ncbi:hypothetical protein DMI60_01615 [Escherichia coli]|nr:hypothetical protein [Escherichia coli]
MLIILILPCKFASYFRRHFCDKRRGRSHLISTLPHNPVFPAKRYGIFRVLQENLCCPTHQSV